MNVENKFNNLSFIDFYFESNTLYIHLLLLFMLQSVASSLFCFGLLLLLMLQHRSWQAGRLCLFVGIIKICQMQIMRININKLHANQQINMSHKTICGPMPATHIMLPLTPRLPCCLAIPPPLLLLSI